MKQKPIVHVVVLVALAAVCALVSNALAARERKLVLPGYYPNALRVPARAPDPVPAPAAASPITATAAPVVTATVTETLPPVQAASPLTAVPPSPVARQKPGTEAPVVTASPDVGPLQKFPPHPDKASVDISGEEASWLHAKGVLFLDARRTSVYEDGHIAGARSFSVWESDVDDKVMKLFDERGEPEQQLQPIVLYCSGGACEDSHMLAQKLWGLQFNNVLVYKDGFPDWQKRGGAVRTGEKR